MAARVCQDCHLKLPNQRRFTQCPRCQRTTSVTLFDQPQADWKDVVKELRDHEYNDVAEELRDEVDWRVFRLKRMGLDHDIARQLAARREANGGYTVDLEDFRKLLDGGATPTQAARILG